MENESLLLLFCVSVLACGLLLRWSRYRPVGEVILWISGLLSVVALGSLCAWYFPLVVQSTVLSPSLWVVLP